MALEFVTERVTCGVCGEREERDPDRFFTSL
jgi:hypothetical protein